MHAGQLGIIVNGYYGHVCQLTQYHWLMVMLVGMIQRGWDFSFIWTYREKKIGILQGWQMNMAFF